MAARLTRALKRALVAVLLAALPLPAVAISLLRDAGVEHALDEIARPILTAAGLPARRVKVLIVNEMSMNAFVFDRNTIFIHAGLFLRLQSADEVQAVIAHEAAHITNGHFARRGMNAEAARRRSMLGLAAGVAAGAASGNPAAGIGLAAGAQSSALGVFLSHTREEESAADTSGLRYLARAGVPPEAMSDVMQLFVGQEAIAPGRRDGYARTHPLSRERLRAIDQRVAALTPLDVDRGDVDYWFARAKAKLLAYLRAPAYTFQRYPETDTSDAARIARAMAHFKASDLTAARREMASLLETAPDDAFLHELAGWIEIESARVGPAIDSYAKAIEIAPRDPLILAGYGRALLARDSADTDRQAVEVLEAARARDRYNSGLLRDLAVAYARTGDHGRASLATAERYALRRDHAGAAVHANRAAGQLPVGSPEWSRAQDVIRAAEQAERR